MQLKYVIVEVMGVETPVLFQGFLQHAAGASGLVGSGRLVAAGFCELRPLVRVWGESISLGVCSRPEDALIIGRACGLPAMPVSNIVPLNVVSFEPTAS